MTTAATPWRPTPDPAATHGAAAGWRAHARLALLVVVEAAAVGLLHGFGDGLTVAWDEAPRWLATTAPADATVAALRYAGLGIGWWLLATTGAYLLARAARLPRVAVAVARVTVPAVRRTVDRAVAAGLTASVLVAASLPALAEPVAPPPGRAAAAAETAVGHAPEPLPPPLRAGRRPPAVVAQDAAEVRAHTIRAGEHLWGIAARVVGEATDRSAAAVPAGDVAPYWVRLVAANEAQLRSGDPDLVHPGERIVLPPLDADR